MAKVEGWRGAEGEAFTATMTVFLSQHSLGAMVLARCALPTKVCVGGGGRSVATFVAPEAARAWVM